MPCASPHSSRSLQSIKASSEPLCSYCACLTSTCASFVHSVACRTFTGHVLQMGRLACCVDQAHRVDPVSQLLWSVARHAFMSNQKCPGQSQLTRACERLAALNLARYKTEGVGICQLLLRLSCLLACWRCATEPHPPLPSCTTLWCRPVRPCRAFLVPLRACLHDRLARFSHVGTSGLRRLAGSCHAWSGRERDCYQKKKVDPAPRARRWRALAVMHVQLGRLV